MFNIKKIKVIFFIISIFAMLLHYVLPNHILRHDSFSDNPSLCPIYHSDWLCNKHFDFEGKIEFEIGPNDMQCINANVAHLEPGAEKGTEILAWKDG